MEDFFYWSGVLVWTAAVIGALGLVAFVVAIVFATQAQPKRVPTYVQLPGGRWGRTDGIAERADLLRIIRDWVSPSR